MRPKLLPFLAALLAAAVSCIQAGEPISVLPENPNYFLWRGQPTALISATEHFGSAINPAFDYVKYLETISADRLNATMVMSGAFIEGGLGNDSFQPPPGKALIPWARSDTPGFVYGGNKFDLSRFDENYFERLKAFVGEASRRGVVVWYIFFTPFFDDHKWEASPWNPTNYVNGPVGTPRTDLYTLDRHGGFLELQEKLIRRVVEELRDADNIIYEPIYDSQARYCSPEWLDHITQVIADAQKAHPHRKLISRNFDSNPNAVPGKPPAGVSVLAWKMSESVVPERNRHHRMPIANTETGFIPTNDAFSRMRAWDFIFAGGGAFIHMDWTLQTPDPAGRRAQVLGSMFGGGPVQRREIGVLNRFIHSLNIPKLQPVPDFVANPLPTQIMARTLAEPGRRYVTYLRQDTPSGRTSIRWTGRLTPRFTEDYILTTRANDGVRLWLNGEKLIDAWTVRDPTEDSARVQLQAGKACDLKIEFFFKGRGGQMSLFWESPSQTREEIPTTALTSAEGQPGITAEHFREADLGERLERKTEPTVSWRFPAIPLYSVFRHVGTVPLKLALPPGQYAIEWLEPATLRPLLRETRSHAAGHLELDAPPFADDLLLSIEAD